MVHSLAMWLKIAGCSGVKAPGIKMSIIRSFQSCYNIFSLLVLVAYVTDPSTEFCDAEAFNEKFDS